MSRPAGLVAELLGILIVGGQDRFSRDGLADMLWPSGEVDRRRHNLNTTLWRLRKAIEDSSVDEQWISSSRNGFVSFNRQVEYSCDVELFEGTVARYRSTRTADLADDELDELRSAEAMYRGELLEGVMSEWVLPHRDRLRRLHNECVLKLLKATRRMGTVEECVYWGEKILESDPFREDVHRTLIELYEDTGQTGRAITQYNRLRSVLQEELDADPSRETQALYYRVIDRTTADAAARSGPTPEDIGAVLDHLETLHRDLSDGLKMLADYLSRN
ncbi:MAG: hypothetical protein HKN24_14625 [Acidimicrobiales bacterium]|nr:hypothetical protein [Acidimicrobiales bacterium]